MSLSRLLNSALTQAKQKILILYLTSKLIADIYRQYERSVLSFDLYSHNTSSTNGSNAFIEQHLKRALVVIPVTAHFRSIHADFTRSGNLWLCQALLYIAKLCLLVTVERNLVLFISFFLLLCSRRRCNYLRRSRHTR